MQLNLPENNSLNGTITQKDNFSNYLGISKSNNLNFLINIVIDNLYVGTHCLSVLKWAYPYYNL